MPGALMASGCVTSVAQGNLIQGEIRARRDHRQPEPPAGICQDIRGRRASSDVLPFRQRPRLPEYPACRCGASPGATAGGCASRFRRRAEGSDRSPARRLERIPVRRRCRHRAALAVVRSGRVRDIAVQRIRRHPRDFGNGGVSELAPDHSEVLGPAEVRLEGLVAKSQHLSCAQVPGRQRKRIRRMLRVPAPVRWQAPPALHRQLVQLRPGIRHGRIEVCELAIQLQREVHSCLHRFKRIFRKAKYVVGDHIDSGRSDPSHRGGNRRLCKALGHVVTYPRGAGFDAEG